MIILGTNSIKDTGFDVANSLRFNAGSNDSLTRTFGTPTNNKKWTYSFWMKHCDNGGVLLNTGSDTSYMYFRGSSANPVPFGFSIEQYVSSFQYKLIPNEVFRDHSAWSNIVIAFDTTQSTASNRVKIYKNGSQITSFNSEDYPSQNLDTQVNSAVAHKIGGHGSSGFYDGYLAETVFIDGLQLGADSFGEFDEDSGIWKPIDVSGLTFGNNGFYLDFEDSSALGNDAAGSNNFTVNNLTAIDQSTDTCTNNFATWNNLIKTTATFSEGNLKYAQPGSNPVFGSLSTIGVTSGKWYAELNYTSGSSHKLVLGVADETFQNGNTTASYDLGKSGTTSSIAYVVNTGDYRVNNSNTSWGSGGGDGDIINMAIDRDNNKIYFGVNGTWGNSSNPASNSGGIPTTALDSSTNWFWGITADTSGTSDVGELNFGSPSYSESGGETDGNGYGNFAHEPPSGYFCLNSKNLAEYG